MRVSEASVDPNAVVVSFGGEEEPSIDVHTLHRRYLPAAVGPLHRFFSKFGGIEPGAVLDDGDDDDDDDDDGRGAPHGARTPAAPAANNRLPVAAPATALAIHSLASS